MDYFNTLNTGDNFTHRKLLLSLWISSLVHTSSHPKKSQQTNDSSSSSLIGSFSSCSIMGVITYEHEITSSIPPAKMFKAFILDSDKLIPKILPQAIKSTEIIEGDGGVVTSRIRWSKLLLDGWTRDSQHTKGSWFSGRSCKKASGQGVRTHPPMVLLAMVRKRNINQLAFY